MGLTTDRHDGCLHEIDPETGQQQCYLILPDGERKNLVQPLRLTYRHLKCGTTTSMAQRIAETYAANPEFYGGTFCVHCHGHFPVGASGEFVWEGDGTLVGTRGVRPETRVLVRAGARGGATDPWHIARVPDWKPQLGAPNAETYCGRSVQVYQYTPWQHRTAGLAVICGECEQAAARGGTGDGPSTPH